jgi:hypothetical protein
MGKVAESVLKRIEKENLDGITSAALLAFFVDNDIRFGEATLRKWVQLGLLPRSVRIGTKGKHQGSKGIYPVRVIRQILRVKELMAKNLTIEEIQQQFLFVRGDIEQLEQTLDKIFSTLETMSEGDGTSVRAVSAEIGRARALAKDLVDKLEKIEGRMTADAAGVNTHRARTEAAAS